MNFKQMILVDHLLNNTLNSWHRPNCKLVFELDGDRYTGHFTPKDDRGEPMCYYYHKRLSFFEQKQIFNSDISQELRSMLFRHVFGENAENTGQAFKYYTENLKHLVFNDVINIISKVDADDYFPSDLEVPEILFDLENIETGQKFEHYIATNKEFTPVSFVNLITDSE